MVVQPIPQDHDVDVGEGITLHYHDIGHGESGVVMYLHGSGPGASGLSNFRGNYPYLVEHGYRTLIADTLGYGHSSKPEEGVYDLEQITSQFKKLLDSIDVSKVLLIGNSMGGAIAIKMALNYPDLVHKLILMAPGGIEPTETYMAMEGISTMVNVVFKEGISRDSLRKLLKLQLYDSSKLSDELVEERYQIAMTQPQDTITRIRVENLENELSKIACPVLCFWGVNDRFCPMTGVSKIVASCKGSRAILVSQCGHWVMNEHPHLFNQMSLMFLNGSLS